MEHLIAWAGFFGAWLLVAGPVFQAALELQEEEVDREAFAQTKDSVPRPDPISGWWWLLPPIALLLQRRASNRYREAVVAAVPNDVFVQFTRYLMKANGWLLVGAGAFFIALKETWELHEVQEWPTWVFWVLTVVMLLVSLGYTVHRMRQIAGVEQRAGGATTPAA